MQTSTIAPGTRVRFFSSVGPCLSATVLKVNRTRYLLDFYGSRVSKYKTMVHLAAEPCRSCQDHAQTMYPNGYMN